MSTYSNNLRIELIANGDQAGTWGTTTNTNLGTIIEDSIAGYATVSVTSTDQALTALDGAADEARNAMIRLTTTTGAAFSVYAPPASKQYIIWNDTSYAATIYNSTAPNTTTAAGTGITIAAGDKVIVFSDGTDFYNVKASGITGVLPVANGGTGLSTYTINGVLYASGTGTLANGSAFTFDPTAVQVSLVSSSATLTDKPVWELKKTTNVTSGQTNTVGRISFNGKWGSTAGEQAYLSLTSLNSGGILDANTLRIATRSISGSADGAYAEFASSAATVNSGNGAEIELTNATINYDATTHNFTGNIASPVFTGTPTAPTAASGTNTTQVATTAFVQTAVGALAAGGTKGQLFTANGTFTVPTGVTAVKVTVIGGGGGGGNTVSGWTTGQGGGGGGGVAIEYLTGLTPGAAIAVTVGSGGSGGAAGGTSSFGAYCSATGGSAGSASSSLLNAGGSGGTGSGGDINLVGGPGGLGIYTSVGCFSYSAGGGGGGAGGSAGQPGDTTSTSLQAAGGTGGLGGRGGNGAPLSNPNSNNGSTSTSGGYGHGGGGSQGSGGGASTGGSGLGGCVLVEW